MMNSLFETIKVVCLVILTVLVVYIGIGEIKAVKADVMAVKHNIKLLRVFLMGSKTPVECPEPGMPTTKLCHYTLQINGPYESTDNVKGKGWFSGMVPKWVVEQGYKDCMTFRDSHEDYTGLTCPDPKGYTYRTYVFPLDAKGGGNLKVKEGQTWLLVNDPVTNHLVALKQIQPPQGSMQN
jgi:hypothetical protein